MPYFVKKVRVELWQTYVCEADDAEAAKALENDNNEIFLGETVGLADGEVMVFGPFATMAEAEDDDCALVETPAQFIAVG